MFGNDCNVSCIVYCVCVLFYTEHDPFINKGNYSWIILCLNQMLNQVLMNVLCIILYTSLLADHVLTNHHTSFVKWIIKLSGLRLYIIITAETAQVAWPGQCYSNGPGNFGNLDSNKELQPEPVFCVKLVMVSVKSALIFVKKKPRLHGMTCFEFCCTCCRIMLGSRRTIIYNSKCKQYYEAL